MNEAPEVIQNIFVFTPKELVSRILRNIRSEELIHIAEQMVEHRMSGYFYERMVLEREIEHTFPAPRFMDWLFRRCRTVIVKQTVSDVILDPPVVEVGKSIRIMTCEIKRNDK